MYWFLISYAKYVPFYVMGGANFGKLSSFQKELAYFSSFLLGKQ
jgi:hypothetical protein